MWRTLPVALVLVAPPAAAQSCPEPTHSADLLALLEVADQAYGRLDVAGFRAAMDAVRAALPCVADPISRHLAAEIHRHEGLAGFVERDPGKSTTSFAAARAIEPGYVFPTTLVPARNPVHDEYGAIDVAAPKATDLPEPATGWLQLDGRTTRARWTDLPVVFQQFAPDGAVARTTYLWPSDPTPAYEPRAAAVVEAVEPVTPPATRKPKNPLLIAAVASGAVAVASYGGSWGARVAYDGADDIGDLDRLQDVTNGLLIVSAGAGAVAAGTGVGAALAARF